MAGAGNQMLILADHASLWYFSVGDLCIQAGCLILLAEFAQFGSGGFGFRNVRAIAGK
jgi:hypothetical protein